jgi:hypothetical protein
MSKRQKQAGLSDEEIAAEVATPLPNREALSLLGSGLLGGLPSGLTGAPSVSQQPTTGDATLPPGTEVPQMPASLQNPLVR